ncbi:MAG TPA: hypothetical protein VKA79_04790 [Aestuariivirgaceae bacterium]|jgi:hypothetical protein|nr:hypothetical protein [Aestuariivirgaceae bacterium]
MPADSSDCSFELARASHVSSSFWATNYLMSGSGHCEKKPAILLKRGDGAGGPEGNEGSGFVKRQPAALNPEFAAGAVLGRAVAVAEQKRLVDFLYVDAALTRLDRNGDQGSGAIFSD